jgi:NAD(P)-dependent dehydrogenase (short-subunit alcohol dehydrogenase family)
LALLLIVQVVAMAGDITSSEAPGTIAEAIRAEFGRIDVLVNNAGEC